MIYAFSAKVIEEYLLAVEAVPFERCRPFIDALAAGRSFQDALEIPALDMIERTALEGLRPFTARGSEFQVAKDLKALYVREKTRNYLDIVWTGPRVPGVAGVRQTFPVARSLVARSINSLLIAGYMANAEILDRLGLRAAIARGVSVRLMSDRVDFDHVDTQSLIASGVTVIDACPIKSGMAKFHVKALVADDREALVTSANFTFLGQSANVELGVLIHGAAASAVSTLLDHYARSLEFVQQAAL